MSFKDLFKKSQAEKKELNKESKADGTIVKNDDIPQRDQTEFCRIGIDKYIANRLKEVINFDPNIAVNQSCKIDGVSEDYITTLNVLSNIVYVVDKKTSKNLASIPFSQLYPQLIKSDPDLDYNNFEGEQVKAYEAKYVNPTLEMLKETVKPKNSISSLFGAKPKVQEVSEQNLSEDDINWGKKPYQASIEDLPSNMQPQAQGAIYEGEVDPMPTQVIKRGRKPKALVVDAPQTEHAQPKTTTTILQDIASNSTSVIEQLKTLGNAIPSAKLPISTNVENDGVVEVRDISFDKFRPTTQFIEAISTVVEEFARYINQAKQK